VSWTTL